MMERQDLLNISKKCIVVTADMAEKLYKCEASAMALPAFDSDIKFDHFAFLHDEDALHVQLFDSDKRIIAQSKSQYNVDNYIYVREPYWLDEGKVNYFGEFRPGFEHIRAKVMPGKFMRKIHARTFLRIKSVSLKLLSDLSGEDLFRLGFVSILDYLDFYDEQLTDERRYTAYQSYKNPYVYFYEFEVYS